MIVLKGVGDRNKGKMGAILAAVGRLYHKARMKQRGESVMGKSAWEDLLSSVFLDPWKVFPISK